MGKVGGRQITQRGGILIYCYLFAVIVWRPGSARTRWRSLQRSPDPLAVFKGPTSKGRGGDEKEGREENKGARAGMERGGEGMKE